MPSNRKILTAVILAILAAMLLLLPVSAASDNTAGLEIRVGDDGKTLDFTVTLPESYVSQHAGGKIWIVRLGPETETDDLSLCIRETELTAAKNLTCPLSCDGSDAIRLYSRYVIAELDEVSGVYTALSDPQVVTGYAEKAVNQKEYPAPASKKGLMIQLFADAQQLGVSNTILNVPLNEFLVSGEGVSYGFGGKTYTIDPEKLEMLDYKVKVFSEAGIRVYIDLMLTSAEDTDPSVMYLFRKDENGNALSCLDADSADAMNAFAGFVSFLASRYTSPEGEYGFAGNYIIGYEVNSEKACKGYDTVDDRVSDYARILRTADIAVRSAYKNGRVYVPFSNQMNYKSVETFTEAGYISITSFLSTLDDINLLCGDFPWQAAVNPYASSLEVSDLRNDPDTTSVFVTMKNIGNLTTLLADPRYQYEGKSRSLLIAELGIHGETGTASEKEQAASYAYAYYTAEFNDQIEAIIYHRHVDLGSEGYCFGIWSAAIAQLEPAEKKQIYDVFKYIDTYESETKNPLTVSENVKSMLGVASLGDVIPGFDAEKLTKRKLYTVTAEEEAEPDGYHALRIFDFARGSLFSFYPTDSCEYIELRKNENAQMLHAQMYCRYPNDYMGIGGYFTDGYDVAENGYLSIRLIANAPEGVGSLNLLLRMNGEDAEGVSCVYEGKAVMMPGNWQTMTFDLGDFGTDVKKITGMKVWVMPSDGRNCRELSLDIDNISAYRENTHTFLTVILSILLVVAVLVLLFVLYIGYGDRIFGKKKTSAVREPAPEPVRTQPAPAPQSVRPVQNTAPTVRTVPQPTAARVQEQQIKNEVKNTGSQPVRTQENPASVPTVRPRAAVTPTASASRPQTAVPTVRPSQNGEPVRTPTRTPTRTPVAKPTVPRPVRRPQQRIDMNKKDDDQ